MDSRRAERARELIEAVARDHDLPPSEFSARWIMADPGQRRTVIETTEWIHRPLPVRTQVDAIISARSPFWPSFSSFAGCGGSSLVEPSTDDPDPTSTATGTAPAPADTNGTLSVHFINVGQSVATLIVGPTGETMLIDTGHFQDDGEYVLQYLQRHDIDRLNHLIVSHNDADHIGGNAAIIEYYETQAGGIGAIYDPGIAASTETYEEYLDAVEAHGVTLYETRAGDTIPFEGVDVEVCSAFVVSLGDGYSISGMRITSGTTIAAYEWQISQAECF